jgi:hypothetical protein
MFTVSKSIHMKAILLFFVTCTFTMFAQEDFSFPMKGDFIYYEFKETMGNSKRCLKQYFSIYDTTKALTLFQPAYDLQRNVQLKCRELNKFTVSGQNPKINFEAPIGSNANDCLGDLGSGGLYIILPGDISFLESSLLYSLLNSDKLKVYSQMIVPSMKIKFYSKNEYSIIFTNIKITYTGQKGKETLNETLDLETVYKTLLEKGKQNDKMYDRSVEALSELDKIIKFIAKTYSEEIKKIYQIDEL